jgi:hypothetical protein
MRRDYASLAPSAPQQEDRQQQCQNKRKQRSRRDIDVVTAVETTSNSNTKKWSSSSNKSFLTNLIEPDAEQKQRSRRDIDVVTAVETTSNDTKKWSSSSNKSCLKNLIELGDVMQLQGFKKRSKLNGTTIEVIRPSINTTGCRWDVKPLNNNNSQRKSCKQKDRIRIISVASSNLRHFM